MPVCTTHHWLDATGACAACGRPFCENCLAPFLGQPHCGPCREQRLAEVQGQAAALPDAPFAGTSRVEVRRWLSEGWILVHKSGSAFTVGAIITGILSLLSGYLCLGAFTCGMYMMAYRKMLTGQVSSNNVFDGFRRFGRALGAAAVIYGGGYALYIALGISLALFNEVPNPGTGARVLNEFTGQALYAGVQSVVSGLTFFVLPHLAARNVSLKEAFAASWQVVQRNPLMYVLASLVFYLVSMSGLLLCVVGVLFTAPLGYTAKAKAYADHFGLAGIEFT